MIIRVVFTLAVAGSAFLIFAVQPMVGKRLLPWYGGAPGVWTVCLAFYQVTLFLGYAYAHWLRRLARPRLELAVHAALFAAAVVILPVLPSELWRPGDERTDATGRILLLLAANVALPFLFLSSTGPLLQAWYARVFTKRSPYFLYALSNGGSLAALLAYPLIVEPNLSLGVSDAYWSFGFGVVGVVVLVCGVVALSRGGETGSGFVANADEGASPAPTDTIVWAMLSGVAVILLMGITNQLCLDIASVPFLWILPLATYLLTFVLAFASERLYWRWPMIAVSAVAMMALPFTTTLDPGGTWSARLSSLPVSIALYLLLLFATCMVAHGELYRRRPPSGGLTAYYLWVSAGGAVGGLLVGVGAPFLLGDYLEVPLGLGAWWLLVLVLSMRRDEGVLGIEAPRWHKGVAAFAALFLVGGLFTDERFPSEDVVHRQRGFFGVLRVLADDGAAYPANTLRHGSTLHGVQFKGVFRRGVPTAYYGHATGIGLALPQLGAGGPMRVGVVGLGAGTLAAYGRPGDLYRFYEIDPAVISLARDSGFFTFLEDSKASVEVELGDGRLVLEDEAGRGEARWDVLVLDAFASDAVPVHLLTKEAMAIYVDRLNPVGVIALHVSNRHIDLAPLCFRLANDAGLESVMIQSANAPALHSVPSRWVFMGRDASRLRLLSSTIQSSALALGVSFGHLRVRRPDDVPWEDASLWSDDYSDVLSLVRPPNGFGSDAY